MPSNPQQKRYEINLHLLCISPPQLTKAAEEFGLQAKDHHIAAGYTQPDGSLLFESRAQVRPRSESGFADFAGPFIHGGPGQRFLYLSWRSDPALPGVYNRRMKIHLPLAAWEEIERAAQAGQSLAGTVQGTGKNGGLHCGSVPLLGDGWSVEG